MRDEPQDDSTLSAETEEVARMSFAKLIRAGSAQGLLNIEWPGLERPMRLSSVS